MRAESRRSWGGSEGDENQTVKNKVSSILEKLDVRGIARAVLKAINLRVL